MIALRESFVLNIEHLAPGGDGVGHIDGQVCFVPFTAPGDRVRIGITKRRSRFLKGELEELMAAGPERREPPCPLLGTCGGCNWLHLTEVQQRLTKQAILSRVLDLSDVTFLASPQSLGYRSLARLHASPKGRNGASVLGFSHLRHAEIVPVPVCPILAPALNRCLGAIVSDLLEPVRHACEVRLVQGEHGPLALIISDHPMPERFYRRAATLASGPLAGVALLAEGIYSQVAGEAESVTQGVDDKPFFAPPLCFGQANRDVNRLIADMVSGWVEKRGFRTALELFAGAANLSVALASRIETYAIAELDPSACRAAKKNLASRGMDRVKVHQGDAPEVYQIRGQEAELVILDPPRRGHLPLARAIAAGRHRAVLYVSCNPSTLARDIAALAAAGYKLKEAAGFDMFPQTAHMEAAVLMER